MELIPVNEFMKWYYEKLKKIKELEEKIGKIKELLTSRTPSAYVGRIIVSTTDDLESKVIAHYGGKRWRRIINFIRGIRNDGNEVPGSKGGESFVCLMESNVPNHTHNVTL